MLNACRYSDASLIALAVSLSKLNERRKLVGGIRQHHVNVINYDLHCEFA